LAKKRISDWLKNGTKDKMVLCFLAGILLLVIAIPVGDKKESKSADVERFLSNGITKESTGISDNASLLESQLEQMLSQIEGIGQVKAMITLEPFVDDHEAPEIRGVLVVSEHGDDPIQILKIQETVMTLFQIDAHKIKVMKLK